LSKEDTDMPITLTEKAASEVTRIREEQKQADSFLRIGVSGGGCSGFNYVFKLDTNYDEEVDSKFSVNGLEVVVDKKSDLYLDGTTIDFMDGLERRGFTFNNPNAKKTCGCGSSFNA
jgi:iron-sulfur cluster assembly protein